MIEFSADVEFILKDYHIQKISEINNGDSILGSDGNFYKIKDIQKTYSETFTIVPDDRGYQFDLSLDSFITVKNEINNQIETISISKIINSKTFDDSFEVNNYKLVRKSLNFNETSITIDPYLLGIYLGDTKCNKSLVKIKEYYKLSDDISKININYDHIPNNYKVNSKDIRLKLLAGFIDSLGSYEMGTHSFEITLTNLNMIKDLVFISRSVGLGAGYRDIFKYVDGKIEKTFRLYIYGQLKIIPTKLLIIKSDCNVTYQDISFTIYRNKMKEIYKIILENKNEIITAGFDIFKL